MQLVFRFFVLLIFLSGISEAETVVNENFDDQAIASPLSYWGPGGADSGWVYDSTNARGGAGYCLRRDDAESAYPVGYGGALIYSDFYSSAAAAGGVYIRYYIKYASNYDFPETQNCKLMKIAGTSPTDIEWIFNVDDGSQWTNIRYQYGQADGSTATGSASISFARDQWHKVEIFLYIPATGTPVQKLQINDSTVWEFTDTTLRRDSYSSTQQINSVRASNAGAAASGQGYVYYDDVLIVIGEGDLTDNEPTAAVSIGRPLLP